jgi:uncharacterized phage protein (TIGR01671 family)
MRELKFRAYDAKNKHYEYISDLYWFEENFVHCQGDNDYTLEQFTGAYDSNGKEVYEGDILKFHPSIMSFMGDGCIWENYGHVNIPDFTTGVLIHYNHPYSEMCDSWADILEQYYGIERSEPLRCEVIGTIHD